MARHTAITSPVMRIVTHPPVPNFSHTNISRMPLVTSRPVADNSVRHSQLCAERRFLIQYTQSPNSEIEKVRNTLMLYSTTSSATLPPLHSKTGGAAPPITMTPFCAPSRLDNCRNWRGTHESAAMFDSTAGPPRKPVLAATNNRPASRMSTPISAPLLMTSPPRLKWSMIDLNTTALRV